MDFFKKDLKNPGVSLGLLAIALGFGGMVAFSGYIAAHYDGCGWI